MLEFTLNQEMQCSADRFWELLFDEAFNRRMLLDGLGFASADIGPVEKTDTQWKRTMRVTPKLDLPGPVAKVLGERFSYTEDGTFEVGPKIWRFDHRLSTMGDRIRLGGKMRAEPLGDDRCLRVSDLWVDAKIPIIGRMIEKAAEKNMRDGYDRGARWFNADLRSKTR